MKNHPQLIQQKLYRPENYLSIKQIVRRGKGGFNLLSSQKRYLASQVQKSENKISDATPMARESSSSYNLSESHHASHEVSHLSTFFTTQRKQFPTRSKEVSEHKSCILEPMQFSWDRVEIQQQPIKQQQNLHCSILDQSVVASCSQLQIPKPKSEQLKSNFFHLNSESRKNNKKPLILSQNNISLLQRYKTLKQVNMPHHNPLTNITNSYSTQLRSLIQQPRGQQQHSEQQQILMDIIKQVPEPHKVEEEYSYRKVNSSHHHGEMNFFQSIDSSVRDERIVKSRSRSVQLCQMSTKMKDMINLAIESTQDFNSFIGSISTKNKRK